MIAGIVRAVGAEVFVETVLIENFGVADSFFVTLVQNAVLRRRLAAIVKRGRDKEEHS